MIIALRRSAQQHKLRVVEFDRHVWTLAFREPADPGPSLTRAPDRSDRRGEGFASDFSGIDRRAYEVAVMMALRERLQSADVWVEGSRAFRAFDDFLLPHDAFENRRKAGVWGADRDNRP